MTTLGSRPAVPGSNRWWRYVAVGGAATAVHYAWLMGWVQLAHGEAAWGAATGAALGAAVAYLANRRYTFAARAAHRRALPRFASVALLTTGLSAALVAGAQQLGLHYLIGQILATGSGLVLGYLLNRHWSFQ